MKKQQRQQLRRDMRQRRLSLSILEQIQAEQALCERALAFIQQHNAHTVALYLDFDGEVPTALLINALLKCNITVCLPRLDEQRKGHLQFLKLTHKSRLVTNRFGILEPAFDEQALVQLDELDVLFTPLVAFDRQGNRLGMGGGFYDRTLHNWQTKGFLPVGIAHRCQQVDALPVEAWDVPLAQIIVV
ncbi:5-formyltetrahydrofolate cyclo-ligase [Pasteurellaceae bacterium HPA106]|uniref:5-formyltetrahydrofolate cyclo-ligase n=1 Tax=Spirabiliibacterium pneumoniae TaxID=221400 RepID=UPI001AAD0438|nr:5-formyltetrahydrofolate cyclo-ligase [Spirabiliibacterium pneumoniae]MBE2895793.1 5-formyltetrahydrofolate cyclo-ligase [Spirabiliibacterium pneumoniae]